MTDEFLWRKQVFPFGAIPWRGRELNFTAAYLGDIADAFARRALDVVPFATEDGNRGFSSDPKLILGEVRSVEVVADGMDVVVEVGAETDALLDLGGLPTGVRIVERYKSTCAGEFPVVLAAVYLTTAPAITGLRPWTRET